MFFQNDVRSKNDEKIHTPASSPGGLAVAGGGGSKEGRGRGEGRGRKLEGSGILRVNPGSSVSSCYCTESRIIFHTH